jgi:SAM-dependent methyltransferase
MDRMAYFIELYGSLPRAGPGDDVSTRRAFEMLEHLPPQPRFLDVGCGPGRQTVELLRHTDGLVVALDLLPSMISRVRSAAEREGFADRFEAVQGDMKDRLFEPRSFDAIWSEGAIYILGFEAGLTRFRELVKPGGYVAVSEPVWLEPEPPREVLDFWQEYPQIDTVEHKLEIVASAGYEPVGHFVLPASSWTDAYYDPLEQRASECEPRWKGIPEAEEVLEEARAEIALFRKYSRYYSYAYFVMRSPS